VRDAERDTVDLAPVPHSPFPTPAPVRSLFLLAEDGVDDTLRPRVDQLGGDPAQVVTLDAVRLPDGTEVWFSLADHLPMLEEAIERERPRLIVIDPLSAFVPSRNRNDEGEVRDILTPLAKLAERQAVAILGVMHVAKPSSARKTALQSLLGATAFGAVARSVLMVAPIPSAERAVLAVVKSNLARQPAALEWSRAQDGPVVWHGPTTLDVEELLGGIPGALRPDPRDAAEAFVREFLQDGPVLSRDLIDAAEEAGITQRTLERVKKMVGVVAKKLGSGWYTMLPDADWDAFVRLRMDGVLRDIRDQRPATPAAAPDPAPSSGLNTCITCGATTDGGFVCAACRGEPDATAERCRECDAPLRPSTTRTLPLCPACSAHLQRATWKQRLSDSNDDAEELPNGELGEPDGDDPPAAR
jgi:hypothetical protein